MKTDAIWVDLNRKKLPESASDETESESFPMPNHVVKK